MQGILFKPWKIKAIADNPDKEWQTRRVMQNQPIEMDKIYFKDFRKDFGGRKPRYHVGSVVYLKEAWRYFGGEEYEYLKDSKCVIYKKDVLVNIGVYKWHNPRTMPAWAARYFIKITGIEAQRLQEITLEDCWDEGIYVAPAYNRIDAYHHLWDSINPKSRWESNPWVFKYTFKLTERC